MWSGVDQDPIMSPIVRPRVGRPKKLRIREPDKEVDKTSKLRRQFSSNMCSICKQTGQNARSCPLRPVTDADETQPNIDSAPTGTEANLQPNIESAPTESQVNPRRNTESAPAKSQGGGSTPAASRRGTTRGRGSERVEEECQILKMKALHLTKHKTGVGGSIVVRGRGATCIRGRGATFIKGRGATTVRERGVEMDQQQFKEVDQHLFQMLHQHQLREVDQQEFKEMHQHQLQEMMHWLQEGVHKPEED
ncbi:hypothetical protein SESBI_02283 [Sesbania bispinosa]|nr:hypothetical protein SESBI_02283 [Sesbania bispinosa]